MKSFLISAVLLIVPETILHAATDNPNIIIILADDLGFGDTGCYGATKILTPNIDRLSQQGLRFTDAHAPSATCTPSRYAMLTGQYPWRKAGTGILPGNAALIIDPLHVTLPSILKKAGYETGLVGKWHLGLGGKDGPDWNGDIRPGPLEVGFDYAFFQPSTSDRVPCVYIENHRVANLDPKDPIQVSYDLPIGDEPTGKDHPELLKMGLSHEHNGSGHAGTIIDGISRIGYMTGGHTARWKDQEKADVLTGKAVEFIERSKSRPFFLEFATHDPHVPRVPASRFIGKSGCGVRGDVIVQFDWCVGQILSTLEKLNLASNTIVILSSDNGPVLDDGYDDGAVNDLNGHKPAGTLRGGKYIIYEGGTRVPFILSWPGRVTPGVSDALVCLVDFSASFASLTHQKIPVGEAPDSVNVMPALLGETKKGRDQLVEHDGFSTLAFRDGLWKYIEATPRPRRAWEAQARYSPLGELYDLNHDLGETNNLNSAQSETSKKLSGELNQVEQVGGRQTGQATKY